MKRTSLLLAGLIFGCSDPGSPGLGALVDAGNGTDSGDAGCATPTTVLADVNAANLRLSGSTLVFVDRSAGGVYKNTEKTRAIRKINVDGTGAAVVHEAAAGHQVVDIEVAGDTVYFIESAVGVYQASAGVYSVPLTGGTPTLLKLHDDPANGANPEGEYLDAIVGIDGVNVYAIRGMQTAAAIYRFPLSGGSEARVTTSLFAVDALQIRSRPTLVNGEFYFFTGRFPAPVNYDSIGKLSASATDALPSQVGTTNCRGNLATYPSGIFCIGAAEVGADHAWQKLSHFDLSAGGHAQLFELINDGGFSLLIGPSDGTSVYVTQDHDASGRGNLYKVPVAGGPASVVACDRRKIASRGTFETGGSNSAYYGTLEMVATPAELAWIEKRPDGSADKTSIFRAAR
ncbi:hypothetical protein BH09MYX1_BH09MYX1_36910 [soil metagenome]